MLTPAQHFSLRQQAMQCALSTAVIGEPASSVRERAQAYLDWVIEPVQPEAVAAYEADQALATLPAAPVH